MLCVYTEDMHLATAKTTGRVLKYCSWVCVFWMCVSTVSLRVDACVSEGLRCWSQSGDLVTHMSQTGRDVVGRASHIQSQLHVIFDEKSFRCGSIQQSLWLVFRGRHSATCSTRWSDHVFFTLFLMPGEGFKQPPDYKSHALPLSHQAGRGSMINCINGLLMGTRGLLCTC